MPERRRSWIFWRRHDWARGCRARADFGQADCYIAGKKVRLHYFCGYLPHADGCFAKICPAEPAEAFRDGHAAALDFRGTRLSGGGHDFVPPMAMRPDI
jgi:hypothetical protein